MTPLVAPSALISISTPCVGAAARACTCDDLRVTDQCLRHCLHLSFCMHAFLYNTRVFSYFYQRVIEFVKHFLQNTACLVKKIISFHLIIYCLLNQFSLFMYHHSLIFRKLCQSFLDVMIVGSYQ